MKPSTIQVHSLFNHTSGARARMSSKFRESSHSLKKKPSTLTFQQWKRYFSENYLCKTILAAAIYWLRMVELIPSIYYYRLNIASNE